MSDEEKPKSGVLATLVKKLNTGMDKISGSDEQGRTEPSVDEAVTSSAGKASQDKSAPEANSAGSAHSQDDDLLEVVEESGQGEDKSSGKTLTLKERLQGLTLVQKGLLSVVVIVGVLALKNQQESAEMTTGAPEVSEARNGNTAQPQSPQDDNESPFESSAGELSSTTPHASGSNDPQIDFGDEHALKDSPGYTPPGEEHPLQSLDDDALIPPGPVESTSAKQSNLDANTQRPALVSGADPLTAQQSTTPQLAEEPSPFEASEQPAFGEAILGGTPPAAMDSSAQAPHASNPVGAVQLQADPQVALLEKTIKDQGDTIRKLEERLAKQTAPMATAKKPQQASAAQTAPKVYASKPKPRARPKLCVSSVAAPARNCTTCVAHAVVVSNGEETMIGNGGSIDGFRVSIVGDTVSLQGEDGAQPHQFWPSTTGCSR